MSRSKKSRSLKSVVSVKTGSKSQILDNDGNKGKIPSKNKLSKHKKKPKSAYAKFLSEKNKKSDSVKQQADHPYKEALRQEALKEKELETAQKEEAKLAQKEAKLALKKAKQNKAEENKSKTDEKKSTSSQENIKNQPDFEDNIEQKQPSKDFKDLDGDELLDFFEQF